MGWKPHLIAFFFSLGWKSNQGMCIDCVLMSTKVAAARSHQKQRQLQAHGHPAYLLLFSYHIQSSFFLNLNVSFLFSLQLLAWLLFDSLLLGWLQRCHSLLSKLPRKAWKLSSHVNLLLIFIVTDVWHTVVGAIFSTWLDTLLQLFLFFLNKIVLRHQAGFKILH